MLVKIRTATWQVPIVQIEGNAANLPLRRRLSSKRK
jgi:hypothetical protein